MQVLMCTNIVGCRNVHLHSNFEHLADPKMIKPATRAGFIYMYVGKTGFEPATPWSQTRCATGLRYFPDPGNDTGSFQRGCKGMVSTYLTQQKIENSGTLCKISPE
jgi:hypothetical protein